MGHLLSEMIALDEQGFILPPEGDPDALRRDAVRTVEWSRSLREELARTGRVEIFGEVFNASQLVPDEVLAECLGPVRRAYRIYPVWVPAFFSNRGLPWYVGGATFYDSASGPFRVCLVLREPFRQRPRWLIYDRSEILSHEACHVARAMMGRQGFEEPLAYAISSSALRRAAGGVFRARWEAPLLSACAVILIAGSALELVGFSPLIKWSCAVPLLLVGSGLVLRGSAANRKLSAARRFLQPLFGENAAAVLFRCSDAEILSLARAATAGTSPQEWLERKRDSLRWQIIECRFLPKT